MIEGKAKVAELKPKAFQIVECLNAGVDVNLLSEAAISVVGDEHHGHPVITGVTHNLFRATAIYNIHEFFSPVASLKGRQMPAARDKKRIVYLEKKGLRLFICGSFTSFQTTQYSQSQL